jgi:hypothetical protein
MTSTSNIRNAVVDAKSRLERAMVLIQAADSCRAMGHPDAEAINLQHASSIAREASSRLARALFAPTEGPAPEAKPVPSTSEVLDTSVAAPPCRGSGPENMSIAGGA